MKKILWVAIAVLMALMVVGCAADAELAEENHKAESITVHTWVDEYPSDSGKYHRSALKFTQDENITETAKVTVEMGYPRNGKAGILFGVQEKDGKYDFYSFAWGWNGNTTNPGLDAYVDYYQGLTSFKDESTDSEQFGTGANITVVSNTPFANANWDGSEKFAVDMYVFYDKESDMYYVAIVKKGATLDEEAELPEDFFASEDVYWMDEVNAKDGTMAAGMSETLIKNGSGAIYSYGMVSKNATSKKVDTTWTLDSGFTKSVE